MSRYKAASEPPRVELAYGLGIEMHEVDGCWGEGLLPGKHTG